MSAAMTPLNPNPKPLPAGLTREMLSDFKKRHGDVTILRHMGQAVVVRQPTGTEWEYHRDMVLGENKQAAGAANERLFLDVALWPTGEDLKAMMARFPAIGDSFGMRVEKLAGWAKDVEEEKA